MPYQIAAYREFIDPPLLAALHARCEAVEAVPGLVVAEGLRAGGAGPEEVHAFGDLLVKRKDAHNLLRPETVESLFVLWRVTRSEEWRAAGWEMWRAWERHARVDTGARAAKGAKGAERSQAGADGAPAGPDAP